MNVRDRSPAPPGGDAPVIDDLAILARVRAGDPTAYSELYDAYAPAARRFARGLASTSASADDLVAEAFTRTLAAIQRGHGPIDGFRPYLFTALRRTAARARSSSAAYPDGLDPIGARRESVSDDHIFPGGVVDEDVIPAFRMLPPRWQQVLWMLEVEGRPVPEVAGTLGLSPNAASALAYRARRGLREAYLATSGRPPG